MLGVAHVCLCSKARPQFAWHTVFARTTSTDYHGLLDPAVTSFQDVVSALFQAANREDVRLRLPQELLKLGLQQRKEHVRACDMTSSLL